MANLEVCALAGEQSHGFGSPGSMADTATMQVVAMAQAVVGLAFSLPAGYFLLSSLRASLKRKGRFLCDLPLLPLRRASRSLTPEEVLKEAKVFEILDKQFVDFWRSFFGYMLFPYTLAVVWSLLRFAWEGGLLWPDAEAVGMQLSHGYFGGAVYAQVVCVCSSMFPAWLKKPRNLYVFIVVSQIRCSVGWVANMPPAQLALGAQQMILARMFLLMACVDARFVFILNAATSIFNGVFSIRTYAAYGYSCQSQLFFTEFTISLVIFLLWLILREVRFSQVRAMQDAKSSRKIESAVETLLCGMCDAVVHLAQDLSLKKPSTQLDAMLVRSPQMAGSFLDLLVEESDKERLRELTRGSQEGDFAGTLHVTLRDSYNTPVPVQLFHTQCFDSADAVIHIVGILEAGDRMPQRPAASGVDLVLRENPSTETGCEHSISETTVQDAVVRESLPTVTVESPEDEEVALWIDTTEPGFPMVQCTQQFLTELGGPQVKMGSKLTKWLASKSRKRFMRAVQTSAADVLSGGRPGRIHARLHPPTLKPYAVDVTVETFIDEFDGLTSVKLKFGIARMQKTKESPAEARPRGSSGGALDQSRLAPSSIGRPADLRLAL